MCPFKNKCNFYNEVKSDRLTVREHVLMKEVFCDSELFMLNKDCKIFFLLNAKKNPKKEMLPIGEM